MKDNRFRSADDLLNELSRSEDYFFARRRRASGAPDMQLPPFSTPLRSMGDIEAPLKAGTARRKRSGQGTRNINFL